VIAVIVITATIRAIVARGSATTLVVRLAGGSLSRGAMRANSTPVSRQSTPGIANAALHPRYLTRKPVSSAATAMPRLPARPLIPIVVPGRAAPCTSIGMPTG